MAFGAGIGTRVSMFSASAPRRGPRGLRGAARIRWCSGAMPLGTSTSAGAQTSTLMPKAVSSARRSLSAASAAAGVSSSFGWDKESPETPRATGFFLPPCSGTAGSIELSRAKASGSAPSSKASWRSSAAPGGASAAAAARAKGISANCASTGLETQICSEHLHRRKRISTGNRSWTKAKSSGNENPLSQRVWPSTVCGRSAPRRHSPLSQMDSTASDSIGAPCLPGSFGNRLKNCVSLEDTAMASLASPLSSMLPPTSSSDSSMSTTFGLPSSSGLRTQESPRLRPASSRCRSPPSASFSTGRRRCLKASTSIHPSAH
mmetsp:Transcript_98921/g.178609  ORF Transcript_98921/g.178609 Transcript_98921/m.178609 type:complete len:319 (-) Transcript_98921:2293-3249(-)